MSAEKPSGQASPELAALLRVLDAEKGRYRGASYAFCGVRHGEELRTLACRFVLEIVVPDDQWRFEGEHHGLVVRRGFLSLELLEPVLAAATLGALQVGGIDARIAGRSGTPFSWNSWIRDHTKAGQDWYWSSQVFDGYGENIDELCGGFSAVAALERKLPSFPGRPFRDLKQLSDFLGLGAPIEARRSSTVDVVLPVYSRLAASSVREQRQVVVHIQTLEELRAREKSCRSNRDRNGSVRIDMNVAS